MFKIKGYIRCKSRPEGSIAEGYIADECLTYCSRFLTSVDTIWNRVGRNEDLHTEQVNSGLPIFQKIGRYLGAPVYASLDAKDKDLAHLYVLINCEEVKQYLE